MKILAIGSCGSMGRYAMRAAQNLSSIDKIVIADIDKESAESFAATLNQSILKSVPIQLTSISDLNLESKYQESFLELTKIHSEESIMIRPDGHIAFKAETAIDYQNIAKEFFLKLGLID